MTTTKEQLLALADKFEQAGNGDDDITTEDVALLGVDVPISASWATFCEKMYAVLTGTPCQPCPFMGRGRSSRWYGKTVADAIRAKADQP